MLTEKEQKSLGAIRTAITSGSLPDFPVTQTKKVEVEYFSNVWIKDESTQETGTHKDRMAWQIILAYKDMLEKKAKNNDNQPLPHASLISAGSAALAIQTQLAKYQLPNLKILVDLKTNESILNHLKNIGCEIYKIDLTNKLLSSSDILTLSENKNGFDITSNKAFESDTHFYDWMSYEILNENPDYVFVPYGTGQLFENLLNITKSIVKRENQSSYFRGDVERLSMCKYIAVTSNNPETLATKLYAPFRPFAQELEQYLNLGIKRGFYGEGSKIVEISEQSIIEANKLMQKLKISSEYSGSVGLGIIYTMKDTLPKDSKILIINTGNSKFPSNVSL